MGTGCLFPEHDGLAWAVARKPGYVPIYEVIIHELSTANTGWYLPSLDQEVLHQYSSGNPDGRPI